MPTRPAPRRTMPKWVAGSHSVPEVAARWVSGASNPAVLIALPAWRICRTAASFASGCARSANGRCPMRPTTRILPRRCSRRALAISASHSGTGQPSRAMPVSRFKWTRTLAEACLSKASSSSTEPMAMSIRSAAAASASTPDGFNHVRIGTVRPAARSSDASAMSVVPSHSAPAAIAARATVPAPCPYPSAFTTAMTRARVRVRAIATFRATASGKRLQRGRLEGAAENAGHCCILGSCVGSAYMGGQPRSIAWERSS